MRNPGRSPRSNADRKVSATGIIDRMRIALGAPASCSPLQTPAESGCCNDAQIGQSVDLILGTGQRAAGAVRHGRELIEDRATAIYEGIGDSAHVDSGRTNIVGNVVGINLSV